MSSGEVPAPGSDLASLLGGDDGSLNPADVRATLGNVASGLAEQLSSITEEMNKIRQELYGESGIGGIASELEKLKAGSLGDLLEGNDFDHLKGGRSDPSRDVSSTSRRGNPASSSASSSARPPATEARRRRTPEERERDFEDIRRKLQERRQTQQTKDAVSIWEKLVLLFLVLLCLYFGSPFFRDSVKRAAFSFFFGQSPDGEEEDMPFED